MTDRDPGCCWTSSRKRASWGSSVPDPSRASSEHALDLARAIGEFDGRVLDLGSGGGLPGLVLFDVWPEATGVLLDAQRRRCDFLARAVATLDLGDAGGGRVRASRSTGARRTAAGQLRSRGRPVVRAPRGHGRVLGRASSGAPARWW